MNNSQKLLLKELEAKLVNSAHTIGERLRIRQVIEDFINKPSLAKKLKTYSAKGTCINCGVSSGSRHNRFFSVITQAQNLNK